MAERYFTAKELDPIFKAAAALNDNIIAIVADQKQEIEKLAHELEIAKAAAANKVELEKLAGVKLDADKATKFANMLADRLIIADNDREKYASACMKSPNLALDIAMHAISLSDATAVSQGHGTKSACTVTTHDEELEKERRLWLGQEG